MLSLPVPVIQILKKMEIHFRNQNLNPMSNNRNVLIALAGIIVAIFFYVKFYLKRKKNSISGKANQASPRDANITLPPGETYEVFLSFRGEDTRKDFTDHLYKRLVNAGVWVFRDNEELRVGEKIGPELVKAIKGSKVSIPIISSEYASSKWCLQELVHILECKKTTGQVVLPIFYRVEPGSVRHQTGTFEKAFRLHEKKYGSNCKDVKDWRNALAEVASLKGWESSKTADGHEGELVEIAVTKVLNELRKATLTVTDYLVGIEDPKEKILEMLEGKESSDAKVVVIHGMGGVGKTTLAKIVFNHLSTSFKHCSFLPNIREKLTEQKCRPEELQKQFVSNILGHQWTGEISHADEGINIIRDRLKQKKVLILFDDVDHTNQLSPLAGERSWFKSGSILIITTRDKDVLKTWEDRLTYELNELDSSNSFLLFCKHAFRKQDQSRVREFGSIAKDIVATTGGLPLAIEVIGSMLLGESKRYWEGVFKKLQKIPHEDVQKKLKISYDALQHEQKQIFLDIACLSIQEKINFAFYMWDDCEFYPEEGIEKLICRSLIKIGEEKQLTIHDQLRDLGREIVRQEDYNELGNRSRLWIKEEALEVVRRKQGTRKVQTLNLFFNEKLEGDCSFTNEQFKDLTKLRFLQMKNANLVGNFENLLLDLRWLQWEECSPDFLPSNFHPTRLLVLDLSYSNITEHWDGWSQTKLVKKLKVLKLEYCNGLTTTPDFSTFEELKILSLRWCENLRRIHPSICNLNKSLLTLDACDCEKLEVLPTEMGEMEELRQLLIDRTSIREIPISEGFMTKLEILSATYCRELRHLPDSIGALVNLVTLSLDDCTSLMKLPESIGNLKSLSELKLSQTKITELPDSIGDLHNLKVLQVNRAGIDKLPATIGKLRNLQHFDAASTSVKEPAGVPDEIGELTSLQYLSFRNCSSISQLPESIHNLSSLQTLDLFCCKKLKSIPSFPRSLTSLSFGGDALETIPDIASLSNLRNLNYYDKFERHDTALNIGKLNRLETLTIRGSYRCQDIENFEFLLELPSNLKKLHVMGCPTLRALPNLSNLKLLYSLKLKDCSGLTEITGLEGAESIRTLEIKRCTRLCNLSSIGNSVTDCRLDSCYVLESLPHLSGAKKLKNLIVVRCTNLIEIPGLDSVECLEILHIRSCPSLERLGHLSPLKMLSELELVDCEKLSDFDGIDEETSLKSLKVVGCNPKIRCLDLSKLKNLELLEINQFEVLTEVKMLQKLDYLKELRISCCNSLNKLPDISLFPSLEEVQVNGCEKLTEIKGLREQKNLRILDFSLCQSLENLPDFSLFTNLQKLNLQGCKKLTEIKGLPKCLVTLDISKCKVLANLPDFSQCHSLKDLHAKGCSKVTEFRGLENLENFITLDISGCGSLKRLPDLPEECIFTDMLDETEDEYDMEGQITQVNC